MVASTLQASPPPGLGRGLQRASVPSSCREGGGAGRESRCRGPLAKCAAAAPPGVRPRVSGLGGGSFWQSKSPIEAAPGAQLRESERSGGIRRFVPLGFACFYLSAGAAAAGPGSRRPGGAANPRGAPETIPGKLTPSARRGWQHIPRDSRPRPPTPQPRSSNSSWSPVEKASDPTYGKTLKQEHT